MCRAAVARCYKQPLEPVGPNLSAKWESALRQDRQPGKSHFEASKSPRKTHVCVGLNPKTCRAPHHCWCYPLLTQGRQTLLCQATMQEGWYGLEPYCLSIMRYEETHLHINTPKSPSCSGSSCQSLSPLVLVKAPGASFIFLWHLFPPWTRGRVCFFWVKINTCNHLFCCLVVFLLLWKAFLDHLPLCSFLVSPIYHSIIAIPFPLYPSVFILNFFLCSL